MSQLHRGLFCCSRGQCSSFAHYPHQPPLIQIKPMEKLIFTRSSPTKGPPRAMFTRWLAHLALTCPNWLYEYFRAHTYFFPSPSLGAFCVGRDGIYFIWNVFWRFFRCLLLVCSLFIYIYPSSPETTTRIWWQCRRRWTRAALSGRDQQQTTAGCLCRRKWFKMSPNYHQLLLFMNLKEENNNKSYLLLKNYIK